MNAFKGISLLLCTNGDPVTRAALDYGVWVAELLEMRVELLGVVEREIEKSQVDALLDQTAQRLDARAIPYQVRLDRGRGSVVIARHSHQGRYLTVFGPLGRPVVRRFVQGRSFRRLLARIETPILYVPQSVQPLRKILLCMGGLGFAHSVKQLCIQFAQAVGAQITILHVVETANLNYPVAHEIEQHWQEILTTATPQGKNLRLALQDVQQAGVQVIFKVRHGNPVHEILDEARTGIYQMIALGSPYSAHSLRQRFLPNVTAEVAEAAGIPALSVRTGYELVAKT